MGWSQPPPPPGDRIPAALASYHQRRRSRVATFRRQARITQKITFARSPLVRRLRNLAVRRTPFFERFVTRHA